MQVRKAEVEILVIIKITPCFIHKRVRYIPKGMKMSKFYLDYSIVLNYEFTCWSFTTTGFEVEVANNGPRSVR